MKALSLSAVCLASIAYAADEPKPAADAKPAPPAAAARPAVQYATDPDSLPQDNAPKGKLEGPFVFKSQVFSNTIRKYWIYVPAQYAAEKPACVLVFQDGHRAQNSKGVLRLPVVMDNLIAKKEMPVTIGIFITPGAKGVEDYDYLKSRDANNRSFEYDSLGDRYARFLMDEMLPVISKQYNLTKDPEGRAIGGTSSGAICAFNVAWERPDQFRKVISCIGSYTDIKGGHVFPKLVRENQKKPIRIFLEDTLHDNPRPDNPNRDWHVQNVAMLAALTEKGYDVKHSFAEGTHSDSHGGSIMPEILRWIWRDYPK